MSSRSLRTGAAAGWILIGAMFALAIFIGLCIAGIIWMVTR